jgi:hypothetical protein
MATLAELQRGFARTLLAAEGAAPAFRVADASDAEERLAIYRRAIFTNYRNALRATYPVVERLVGASFFGAAADAFVDAQPSHSGDLNDYGDTFAAFLAAYPPAADLPYLRDVARLEWAIDEANRAAEVAGSPEAVLAALTAVPADRLAGLTLRLAPSCRLIASAYPIFRIWQVNQLDHTGEDRVDFDGVGDALLVRRDAAGIGIERLASGEFAWLAALADGAALGASIDAARRADAAFDLGRALHAHIGAATIVSIAGAG